MYRGQGSPPHQLSHVSFMLLSLDIAFQIFGGFQIPSAPKCRFSAMGNQFMLMLVLYNVPQNRRTLWACSVLVRFKIWSQLDFFLFIKHDAVTLLNVQPV